MLFDNRRISETLERLAALLEIKGDNPFRIRAYRNAALAVENLTRGVGEIIAEGGDLASIPGVGGVLAEKIREIALTGKLGFLAEIEREIPPDLLALTVIPGLGPRRINLLFRRLGVTGLAGLIEAAEKQLIRGIPGFGEKTEARFLREARAAAAEPVRIVIDRAEELVSGLLAWLKPASGLEQVTVAGSFRRRRDTVGDLDILAVARDAAPVNRRFLDYGEAAEVLAAGETRTAMRLDSGIQVDLRVVPAADYGAALHYFTGSKAHNVAVRQLAMRRQLKISEYGVFDAQGRKIAGDSEESVYRQVGLPYIEPELRENRGELEAARRGVLPVLVGVNDIAGDLHAHTDWTDGRCSLAEMVAAAKSRGYRYLAVCDHSHAMTVARGLDADGLARQAGEIDRLREQEPGFTILKGVEVDILPDGTLDLPDRVLARLDLVVAAVHTRLDLPESEQTTRVLRAIANPLVDIIAHPTGRLLNRRRPCALDMPRIMRAAADAGCCLEVNAHPSRLDLDDIHCRMARDTGARVAISTDAHRPADFSCLRHGVDQARRGWLEAGDVINTRGPADLAKLLRRHRGGAGH